MSEQPEAPSPWQLPPPADWQPPAPPNPPYGAPPGWQPPPYGAPPGWQPPPYGAPPNQAAVGWHSVGGYPNPAAYPNPYGYPQPHKTNGFAIASLVCSLVGILVAFLGPALGIIFGFVGLRHITQRGESGRGLAIAGIVVGCIVLLLDVIGVISIANNHNGGSTGGGVSV